MDWETWKKLSSAEKEKQQNLLLLSPQLIGLEGWRVEAVTKEGETKRFYVGRSTGWVPIHLEIKTRRSLGGYGAEKQYVSVRKLYKK